MHKRGQISVYIILGVIILAVFSIYLNQQGSTVTSALEQQLTIAPEDYLVQAKAMTQECLQEGSITALTDLGWQGRLEMKNPIQLYDGTVEVMSIDRQPHLPSIETLADETSSRINRETDACIRRSILKEEYPYVTQVGDTKTSVTFGDQAALVEARIPIEVTVEGQSYNTEQFAASIPLQFPLIYSVAAELVSLAQEDPRMISAEILLWLPLPISILTVDTTHYVYEIRDPQSQPAGEPFVYRFAVSFTGDKR